MIAASELEVRAGPQLLLQQASFMVGRGDKIGLVGRNGAGKTTLTRILAGESKPAAGTVTSSGSIAYLPQDARAAEPGTTVRSRILAARGLDTVVADLRATEQVLAEQAGTARDRAMARYARLEDEFLARGGYAAESEAATIAASLGLGQAILDRPVDVLSGGQRRRVELARVLYSQAEVLLLDEPTNHLDADSVHWLRDFLRSFGGGLVVISHDTDLLERTVTGVFHLDATRGVLDVYSMTWKRYLQQRETDERRRHRERSNAERKAAALSAQADRMRAKASKASAAQNMDRRAKRLLDGLEDTRQDERVAKLRLPEPAPCGRVPLTAQGLSKTYGSEEVFTDVDLAIDRGARVVVLGLNGAGKTTLLRLLAGVEVADTGQVQPGHGLRLGYFAQEHDTLDLGRTVLENMRTSAPHLDDTDTRTVLGSFLFSGDDANKPAAVLSGGERTRLALATLVVSSANVLLLDEPTNNLDPASRAEVLSALRHYPGAIVLVTHDEGAVDALDPERVLLLPDGVEDLWGADYRELVALA